MVLIGEAKNIEYKQEYSKTILKTVCAYAIFMMDTSYWALKMITQLQELRRLMS